MIVALSPFPVNIFCALGDREYFLLLGFQLAFAAGIVLIEYDKMRVNLIHWEYSRYDVVRR